MTLPADVVARAEAAVASGAYETIDDVARHAFGLWAVDQGFGYDVATLRGLVAEADASGYIELEGTEAMLARFRRNREASRGG